MTSRLDRVEWKLDCLQSRMDALVKTDAYSEREQEEVQRKFPKGAKVRANRQGSSISTVVRVNLPMVVTTDGEYHWTKLVRADRADANDPCWEGYEQAGTKEKDGRAVPNCVKADGEVDVERIVKRLLPGASSTEIAKVTRRVSGKLTRDGRPGEVDAVALVKEYLGEERTRARYGDAAVADAQGDVKIKSNVFDGTKYVPLEARETNDPKIFDIFLDGKLMVRNLPFGSVYSKMKEIEKSEGKPVPKKAIPAGGGYRSEMSVFFPRVRR